MNKYSLEELNEMRQDFINKFSKKYGGKSKLKYLGIMNPDDLREEDKQMFLTKFKGTEVHTEIHMFELKDGGIPIMSQWRVI